MECAVIGIVLVVVALIAGVAESARQAKMTPEQKAAETWGPRNPAMICPHCQTKGHIRTKIVERKKGVSGAKATGALLTGGISLLATGLSRKENPTQAHCDNCENTWEF
jgi:hypothetical protein